MSRDLNRDNAPAQKQLPTKPNRRRGALIVGALLVFGVATPAIAGAGPWQLDLGSDGTTGKPISVDRSPLPAAATGSVAVLRRPQTQRDRNEAAPLLHALGTSIDGVQADGIRSPAAGWVIVPVEHISKGPGASDTENQLCLTNGDASGCGSIGTVSEHGVGLTTASLAGVTTVSGVVPDGVARVRFRQDDDAASGDAVTDNFYSLSISRVAPTRMIPAPKGFAGPTMIPSPPMPVEGTIEWLDESGHVVGPAPDPSLP